jgi:hypothetical protein
MSRILLACSGGAVVLPDAGRALVDADDGGNLIVNPPRPVWERSELTPGELTLWSLLVAATGRAMLDTLPQLDNGCINYWEAGNWSLNEAAEPRGPKRAPDSRRVHLHLLGRSPAARSESWRWGEAPKFPEFADRERWCAAHRRLAAEECRAIVARARQSLVDRYGFAGDPALAGGDCAGCGYPTSGRVADRLLYCSECAP